MINLKKKKAFTIVELVIVIAVIAILAAVLIPTFQNVIRKANYSSDLQKCRNINTSLDTEFVTKKPEHIIEVQDVLNNIGYDNNLSTVSSDYHFYWYEGNNQVYLVNDKFDKFDVTYPEDEYQMNVTKANSYRLDEKYYAISCNIEGITIDKKAVLEGSENVEITLTATDVDIPAIVKINGIYYYVTNDKITVESITSDVEISEAIYFAVTFDKQSGTGGTNSVCAINGLSMPSITLPTRTGYSFKGYYSATNGSGTQYYNEDGESVTNYDLITDTTLYAYWVACTYGINYINPSGCTYNGSGTDPIIYTYGVGCTLFTNDDFTYSGYTLVGWYENSDFTGDEVTSISATETGEKTFYGKWEASWKSLTATVGANLVKYYPVFADASVPSGVSFATKTGDTYIEIKNPTMSTLASYADAGTLYYKGGTVVAVRSVDVSWNNTFKYNGDGSFYCASTDYDDLKSGIITLIDSTNESVEGLTNDSGEIIWTVNGVDITNIYSAYNSEGISTGFGGSEGNFWTNKAQNSNYAFRIECLNDEEDQHSMDATNSVLISRQFN